MVSFILYQTCIFETPLMTWLSLIMPAIIIGSVNVRLLGERLDQSVMEAPNQFESQQARWPALYACPNCWREDRSWEEEQVFKHLHSMYWSGNPSYLKIPAAASSSDSPSSDIGGAGSRLRWKLTIIVFGVAVMMIRLFYAKKVRHFSGKHKK